MIFVLSLIRTLHICGSVLWLGSIFIVIFIFHPVFKRYAEYVYFENFKQEFIDIFIKLWNILFLLNLVTGAALVILSKKNIISGLYALLFSGKMILLLLSIFLIWPYLKQMTNTEQDDGSPNIIYNPGKIKTSTFIVILFFIVFASVLMGHWHDI